jgi:hypothetical protein
MLTVIQGSLASGRSHIASSLRASGGWADGKGGVCLPDIVEVATIIDWLRISPNVPIGTIVVCGRNLRLSPNDIPNRFRPVYWITTDRTPTVA